MMYVNYNKEKHEGHERREISHFKEKFNLIHKLRWQNLFKKYFFAPKNKCN